MKSRYYRYSLYILVGSYASMASAVVSVSFQDKFFARTTPSFSAKDTSNVVGTFSGNSQAIVIDKQKTPGGNWALKIQLTEGPRKGKSYWVYYDNADPGMTLRENGKKITPDGHQKIAAAKPAPKIDNTPSADSPATGGDQAEGGNCRECSSAKGDTSTSDSINEIGSVISDAFPSAFKGALKTMAVMYQSCSVLDKKPYPMTSDVSIDKYLNFRKTSSSLGHGYKVRTIPQSNATALAKGHYYLKDLKAPENNQCQDMRKRPPLYTYGGKPSVTKTEINLLIKQPTSGAAYSGLDCSTFVSTALTAAGLRIKPGQPIVENRATSTQLANFTEKNSCFSYPPYYPDSSLQSGDIFAYSGHTFMIDTVGKDPFGFDKMKARGIRVKTENDCYRLPADAYKGFDFRIIQSAGLGSLAISRVEGSQYIQKSSLLGLMKPYMTTACLAKVTGKKVAQPKSRQAVMLRHRGQEVAGCVIPKTQIPHMTGEECVQSCTN